MKQEYETWRLCDSIAVALFESTEKWTKQEVIDYIKHRVSYKLTSPWLRSKLAAEQGADGEELQRKLEAEAFASIQGMGLL